MSTPAHGVADATARERALDPARSCIVKAPAGSGKTSLLVARYLALLATAERPEEVLAITFTRKAAAEMRARVLHALQSAGGPAPDAGWAARLHALASAARRREEERDWGLRDNPQRLAIQTIDSLCASLARRLPVVSGLGGALATLDDARHLYRAAARRTVALMDDGELGPAVLRTLDHLDGNVANLETLLAQMLPCRDQWMRYLRTDATADHRVELEEGLGRVVRSVLARARGELSGEPVPELVACARFAAERARALAESPELLALEALDALPPATPEALPAWKGLAALLLTGSGTLRKRPPGGVFSAKETRDDFDRMKALLETLQSRDGLAPALGAVAALPRPAYDDAQWATLVDLFQVLRLSVAALRIEFARAGATDFVELVAGASLALGEDDAPTDLAFALDYRFRHLLVDEFQDTSAGHFEIVRKLTAGWTPGDGRSLFVVGDPMQSIYRFREAEVGLFLECFGGGLSGLDLEPVALSANFRSQAAVVDWVNRVFPSIMPARDDAVRAAVAYESSTATHPEEDGTAVEIHAGVHGDEADAARRVAEVVANVRAQMPGASIAILLRARGHAPALLEALAARDLRWRGVDLEPLFQVPAVRDLHALGAALLHPLDRVSWLAVLRAPWCGLTLDDLEALAGEQARAAIPALLGEAAFRRRLSAEGQRRLERCAGVLALAVAAVGSEPLSRILARTWRALGGPACLDGARLQDAHRYLALVAEIEDGVARPDPDDVARRAEELYASPHSGSVDVEIMTIHKAKGLEFDVVLLPGLERAPAQESGRLLAWSEIATPAGPRLLLAPMPPPEGEDASPLHALVRREERDKRRRETARLFYVACTRARRRLHLFASVAHGDRGPRMPPADSLLACAWPAIAQAFEQPAAGADDDGAPAAAPTVARLPEDWCPPSLPPGLPGVAHAEAQALPAVEFSWAGHTARQIGTVAHGLLHRISEDGPDAWDEVRLERARAVAREWLRAGGVPGDEVDAAAQAVDAALSRTVSDPRGRWLLDPEHEQARSEYAITGAVDGVLVQGVVDRTFVDQAGTRWIVDYKVGSHGGGSLDEFLDREQERYRPQLERYAALMHSLDPRPQRVALYFPATGGWRDWAPRCPS